MVNPLAKTKTKSAVKMREDEKRGKYGVQAKNRGIQFIPAVIDVFGDMGKDFLDLLKIARFARSSSPYAPECSEEDWAGRYAFYLKKHVATVLAYGNHLMVEEALVRSLKARDIPTAHRTRAVRKTKAHFWTQGSFYMYGPGLPLSKATIELLFLASALNKFKVA